MTENFPMLNFPSAAVYDTAKVRLGDGFISAKFPAVEHYAVPGAGTSRRALFAGAATIALAGCAGFSISQTSADISMIAKGVKAILPLIAAVTGIGAPIYATIVAVVSEIEALANANTTAVGNDVWMNVGVSLKKLVGLVTGIHVPFWVNTVLSAAVALVTSYLPVMGAATPIGMTPNQARTILLAAGK